MDVTASTQVAVASSSASTVNRAVYPKHAVPDPNNLTVHPISRPNNLHPSASVIKPPNTPFQPIRNVNSAPESKNIHRNPSHNWRDNTRAGFSPRRRRNNEQHQNPRPHVPHAPNAPRIPNQNAHNNQNAHSNQNVHNNQNAHKQNVPVPSNAQALVNGLKVGHQQVAEPSSRLTITGYPPYATRDELLEVFTRFGTVTIERFTSHATTLKFASEAQARAAIDGGKRLHVYGHFLNMKPHAAKAPGPGLAPAAEGPASPKRDFTMSKQKSTIISPLLLDLSGDFDCQMQKILAAIRLTQEDISKIQALYKDLEDTFQKQWPGCKAVPFGSITTGLGISSSDADCYISLPPIMRQLANHVNRAKRLLMQQPATYAEILAIPRANTPIVKFYHIPTDINCDLTFKTPLGTQNSRLVSFLLQSDPRITPVAVIIKYWAKINNLTGTGRLSNYALTLMIIAYLQQPQVGLLPSVAWLQRDPADELLVDRWNTGYMSDPTRLPPVTNTATASELLGGFFTFYCGIDFEKDVVCPYLGTIMKKADFVDPASLPDEFAVYKRNVLDDYAMPFRHQAWMCVQDPFEQCHNVTSMVSGKLCADIQAYLSHAAVAYGAEKETAGFSGFFRKILIDQPKISRPRGNPDYRVNLFPRILNMIASPEWKSIIRDLVRTVFEDMLRIKLEKKSDKEQERATDAKVGKEKERYTGTITKPIWKRKKYKMSVFKPGLGLEARQAAITDDILRTEPAEKEKIEIQLMLTFANEPRSTAICVKALSGHGDSFRNFGRFYISVMQNWFAQLLRPYALPNCQSAAANIVKVEKTSNDDNNLDSDDEITPGSTNELEPAEEEKTSASITMSELFASTTAADELSQEDVDDVTDACARV